MEKVTVMRMEDGRVITQELSPKGLLGLIMSLGDVRVVPPSVSMTRLWEIHDDPQDEKQIKEIRRKAAMRLAMLGGHR